MLLEKLRMLVFCNHYKDQFPGVTIGQVNQAGEEASINIRGTSTLNGNKNPLIVVDNIIFFWSFFLI